MRLGERVQLGDYIVVLVVRGWRRRLYHFRVERGRVYSTFAGVIRWDELVGLEYGSRLERGGATWFILPAVWVEVLEEFGVRRSQVIYPKDSAYLVVRAGLRPGSRVFEAGLGSGFLTSVISSVVCPTGLVYGVEVRRDMLEAALENLRLAGLDSCLVARLGDVRRGVGARGLDAGFLDMPDPWEALDSAWEALRPGAPLIVFLPTMTQLDKLAYRVESHGGFAIVEAGEILRRDIEMVPGAVRPSPRMVGHTGYYVVLRRLAQRLPYGGEGGERL